MAHDNKKPSSVSVLLLGLTAVFLVVLLSTATAQDVSILKYQAASAKVYPSRILGAASTCRVAGKIASLAVSKERKNGVLSFRPKLNRPCTANIVFSLGDIDPMFISTMTLSLRFRGPEEGISLLGPKRNVNANGISFSTQEKFDISGDGRTFERFIFSFESVPRDIPYEPLGELGLEYLFKGRTLELQFLSEASGKKIIAEFDEVGLDIEYFIASPFVGVNQVADFLSEFEKSINQGKTSTTVDAKLLSKVDARIGEVWTQNVGTTTIVGGVVQVQDNSVLVTGSTTLPSGDVVDISQGVVTYCSDTVCSVTAISKVCLTSQTYKTSIIKGYVGAQFASLPSAWLEVFVPDFALTNCIYFATGDTVFDGYELHAGVNIILNGLNPIFNPVFPSKSLEIVGLIGLNCGEGCLPTQEYSISPPDISTYVSTPGLTLKSLAIVLHEIILLPADLTISGIINLKGQDVTLSASYQLGGALTLTASLPNLCWNNPFGLAPFLMLCELGGNLVFDPNTPKFFVSGSITASAIASFSPTSPSPIAVIITVDGGVALIMNNLPFGGAITAVVAAAKPGLALPSELNDIAAAVPYIQTLAISTFDTGAPYDVEQGLTVILPIKVGGNFADTLKSIFPNPEDIQLALVLRITPSSFVIALTLSDLVIYADMKIVDTSLSLTIESAAAPTLAIQTGLEVQISNNPGPLTFFVLGTFQGKSIGIAGGMIGYWVDPFDLHGFILGDVAIDVGFGPPIPPAIVRLGVTAKMIIATKYIRFAGLVDIQQPQLMFLYAELSGQDGQAFTLLDVIQLALTVANKASGQNLNWDLSGVPGNWGLDNVLFKIAPSDSNIGLIEFQKGFEVQAGVNIFGIVLQISIRTYDLTIPGVPVKVPDFNLNFLLDATEFNNLYGLKIQNALTNFLPSEIVNGVNSIASLIPGITATDYISWPPPGMDFNTQFFALNHISVTDFGFYNFFTAATPPLFSLSINVWGTTYNYDTPITMAELFGDIETLLEDRILSALNIPDCITSAECSGECDHTNGAWHCVSECPPRSGKALSVSDVLGCVPCLTEADCGWSGSAGGFCVSGQCMSQSECAAALCGASGGVCLGLGVCAPYCDGTNSDCGPPGLCISCELGSNCQGSGASQICFWDIPNPLPF